MGKPDFKAFREYMAIGWDHGIASMSIPRSVPGPTSSFFILDIGRYNDSNQQDKIRQSLETYVGEVFDKARVQAAKTGQTLPDVTPGMVTDLFLQNADTPSLSGHGGGVAIPISGFAIVDGRSSSLSQSIGSSMDRIGARTSAREEEYFDTYVRHHEAAHAILQQGEAGADFTAAVLTLRSHPEARDMLRLEADARLVRGMNVGARDYDVYGAECHDAIEKALSLSPKQIQSMSIEDIHKMGKVFDDANRRNGRAGFTSPEDRVHERLMQPGMEDIGRGLSNIWRDASAGRIPTSMDHLKDYFIPRQGLDAERLEKSAARNRDSFPQGSVEDRIVENIQESMGRLKQRLAPLTP